jgi:hypothetical protein
MRDVQIGVGVRLGRMVLPCFFYHETHERHESSGESYGILPGAIGPVLIDLL